LVKVNGYINKNTRDSHGLVLSSALLSMTNINLGIGSPSQ